MSSEVKRCVQCGLLKDTEEFRKYTYSKEKETDGRYRVCKSCEAINQAFRRAKATFHWNSDGSFTYSSGQEGSYNTYKKILQLYKTLEARGLRVPAVTETVKETKDPTTTSVERLLQFYSVDNTPISTTAVATTDIPKDLSKWLEDDFNVWVENDLTPEYLQETVYESLKAKYRPQIGINKENYMPIYDDTYKDTLNKILRRFDDFEEAYSSISE